MGKINPDFTGGTTDSECPEPAPRKGHISAAVKMEKKRRGKITCEELPGKEQIKREASVRPLPASLYPPQPEHEKEPEPAWTCPEKGILEV